jgi:hypothetical protein
VTDYFPAGFLILRQLCVVFAERHPAAGRHRALDAVFLAQFQNALNRALAAPLAVGQVRHYLLLALGILQAVRKSQHYLVTAESAAYRKSI